MSLTHLEERIQRKRRLPAVELREPLRRGAGITRVELAEDLGVTPQTIYLWEKGLRTPRGANRDHYTEALEIFRAGGS